MRKIRLLFLAMSVAVLAGCTADMDKFTERLDDLEARWLLWRNFALR